MPTSVANGATTRMSRLPARTRLKMSRPNWSVPKKKLSDGGCRRALKWNWFGSYGAMSGQAMAHAIHTPTTSNPSDARGERTIAGRASRIANPGVQHAEEQFGAQIRQHVDRRHHHHARLEQ